MSQNYQIPLGQGQAIIDAAKAFNEAERAAEQRMGVQFRDLNTAGNGGGITRLTTIDGKTTETRSAPVQSYQTADAINPASLATSARSPNGGPVNFASAKPTDIARYEGYETTFANLQHLGVITKDAAGNWVEVGKPAGATFQGPVAPHAPQKQQQQDQAPQADATVVEPLDPAGEAIASELLAAGKGMDLSPAVTQLVHDGALSPEMMATAAARLGIPEEQVNQKIATLRSSFEAQAHKAADPDVLDWANRNSREALSKAVMTQVNQGSLSGYHDLTRSYMENLDTIDPGQILDSVDAKAREIRQEKDGRITLHVPGMGRVDWKVAVRAGIIGPKLSR